MTEQQQEIPPGYMQDAKGRLVPDRLVKDWDRLEDETVDKMMGYARELSDQIARFKGHCFDDCASLMDLLAEQYDIKKGGKKGNVSFTSFDGCQKVTVQVQEHIQFGPELQVAKDLIDDCILRWSDQAEANLQALVTHAFAVDKQGQVNREALLSLRRLNITDETWRKAMQAITDSIRVTGSKSYMRFYERPTPEAAWQAITIDIAKASEPKESTDAI